MGESSMTTILTTSLTQVVADITATVVAILPIALGLLGLTIAVAFGIRYFKKIVGQA